MILTDNTHQSKHCGLIGRGRGMKTKSLEIETEWKRKSERRERVAERREGKNEEMKFF